MIFVGGYCILWVHETGLANRLTAYVIRRMQQMADNPGLVYIPVQEHPQHSSLYGAVVLYNDKKAAASCKLSKEEPPL